MRLIDTLTKVKEPKIDGGRREGLIEQMTRFLRCGTLTLEDWRHMSEEEKAVAEEAAERVWAEREYAKSIAAGADPINAARLLVPIDDGATFAQEFLERKVDAYIQKAQAV